ncbi:N-acetyltransferase family protein [Wenyingzhuangia sp. IMCC45467]
MNVIVRKGELKDASGVFLLIKELAEFEKEPDAVEVTLKDIKNDGFGEHPKFEVFVAELNGNIVGMALFYYRYSTWKGKTLHLEDLIVQKEARGKGVGKLLYNEVLKYAYQQKLKRVEWAVLNWNTPAIQFYENSGAVVFDDWRVVQMSDEQLNNYINTI